MPPIIACIPNFSEGRDPAVVQTLCAAVRSVPDVWLLDHTMDGDHHRSVLTFAGPPDAVVEAAFRAIARATELIDLRHHDGVHPRIGATDVVPFVPVQDVTMEECVQAARALGQKVGRDLRIPVYLYEQAAPRPDQRRLEQIRRGGLSALAARMEAGVTGAPDFGPARLHETAGAVVIGARRPLIAFNVNLTSTDLKVARTIAKVVRHSNGGLPCLKAIGVELPSRGLVQVAMNLTDYRITSMHAAFDAVNAEAAKHGVAVAGSELIGLVPRAALDQAVSESLHLERFDPTQVLESRLHTAMSGDPAHDPSLSHFLNAVANARPTPAGGSVAALVGALAAALGVMGARVSGKDETRDKLLRSSHQLHALVRADTEAYHALSRSRAIPRQGSARSAESDEAWQQATEIPLEIAEIVCRAGGAMGSFLKQATPAVHADLMVGLLLAVAAVEGTLHIVRVNVKHAQNQQFMNLLRPRILKVEHRLEELKELCYTPAPDQ
jgi:glutamate formiminotransferase/glutamate formiminotransferase/formiminotetrahydrofolate cyclodeaminase